MNAKAAQPEDIPEAPDTGEPLSEFRGRQIDAMVAHLRHLTGSVSELLGAVRRLKTVLDSHAAEEESWQRATDTKLDAHAAHLAANTAITQEIAERKKWWAGTKERLVKARAWIIGIASTVAAIVTVWLTLAEAWSRKGPPAP